MLIGGVSHRDEKRGSCSSLYGGEVEAEGVSVVVTGLNYLVTGGSPVHGPGVSYPSHGDLISGVHLWMWSVVRYCIHLLNKEAEYPL